MLSLLERVKNTLQLIPNEFSEQEITQIKDIFGGNLHSKKAYSLYNPEKLLSESCQWYDDTLYVDYGYETSLTIRKGVVMVNKYRLSYTRKDPISYIPVQHGLFSFEETWETLDDLRKIATKWKGHGN